MRLSHILVQQLADKTCDRLALQVIRAWQKLPPGFGRDMRLKNLWEETCVQIRQESPLTELYKAELSKTLASKIRELPKLEVLAVWLQTYDGQSYAQGPTREKAPDGEPIEVRGQPSGNPDDWPVRPESLVSYVLDQYLTAECWNYENARIRSFIDG